MAAARDRPGGLLIIIIKEGISIPVNIQRLGDTERGVDIQRIKILHRPDLVSFEVEEFLNSLDELLQIAGKELKRTLPHEAQRLLRAREYEAAVISAITHLETTLRKRFDLPVSRGRRFVSVGEMLKIADRKSLLGEFNVRQVLHWIEVRNQVVHSQATVSIRKAREIVNGVEHITSILFR